MNQSMPAQKIPSASVKLVETISIKTEKAPNKAAHILPKAVPTVIPNPVIGVVEMYEDEHGLTDYGFLMKLMGEPIKDDIEQEESE